MTQDLQSAGTSIPFLQSPTRKRCRHGHWWSSVFFQIHNPQIRLDNPQRVLVCSGERKDHHLLRLSTSRSWCYVSEAPCCICSLSFNKPLPEGERKSLCSCREKVH